MREVNVYDDRRLVGTLQQNAANQQYSFIYSAEWLNDPRNYPLSPSIPLAPGDVPATLHNSAVYNFFVNLLPEGQAFDEASALYQVSKTDLFGLLAALGRETAGALSIRPSEQQDHRTNHNPVVDVLRPVSSTELVERIKSRPSDPFSVWDHSVWGAIAGYQDKLSVLESEGEWFLASGEQVASTIILKPEPINTNWAGLTSNEFFCMLLSRAIGLPTAQVALLHLPEPVLAISRFDRRRTRDGVVRINAIDGCQALGLAPMFKYELLYGTGLDVRHYRDGASLPKLFELLKAFPDANAQRLQLLRWCILQVVIGNTDAHAKNVSFFNDHNGMRLAPAYDLVSTFVFSDNPTKEAFSMAIGDAFTENEMTPYEWAHFGFLLGLSADLIASELTDVASRLQTALPDAKRHALNLGADSLMVEMVSAIIERTTAKFSKMARRIAVIEQGLFL
ncbi:HipA domain-containing protein [Undibacterium terreum]|uniref:Serine/threonine-protein kinase HipA n=1 Tax=Undibacterium terreum TaxID=1224302 RepID=A0A916UY38_9BURK|nr:HipA domain-containing protein [Undibacterium terreum]GGC93500.1 serine/threonine-protein kinase HipA [Undibacterium terreum]